MKPHLPRVLAVTCFVACSDPKPVEAPRPTEPTTSTLASKPPETANSPLAGWEVPAGWKTEVIPFPLGFAPTLAHRGFEELRFPPGFFDPSSSEYWSYAFVWRTEDAASLDATALGAELQTYFRGLIAAVDEKQRITARDEIVVHAEPGTAGAFALRAHVFDAFKTAQPVDLVGIATRRACSSGALWTFVLAPETTSLRPQLEALARGARC